MPSQSESEEKILAALRDKRWDYRTVEGIAEDTALPPDFVLKFLESRTDIVLKSAVPDRQGHDLYTLLERQSKSKDFWRSFGKFTSKSANEV